MSMTMLQIIQQAVGEMGSGAVPSYVASNTAQDTVQQFYLLNGLGQSLMRDFIWQDLNKQYIVTVSYTTLTGSTVNASTTLTVTSTATIDNTYGVAGTGINQACYINSITNSTTAVLSHEAIPPLPGKAWFIELAGFPWSVVHPSAVRNELFSKVSWKTVPFLTFCR